MPLPGSRTRKAVKILFVACLILLTVSSSIGNWLPGLASFFASWFPSQSISTQTPTCTNLVGVVSSTSQCPAPSTGSGSNVPNSVGADAVPNLSLPRTVMSNLDSLINDGGVVQESPQNLTLYNLDISMRLLGGQNAHDQILGSDNRILGSSSFWSVQVNSSGQMIPLHPTSSSFKLLGTNSSGTSIARTMDVQAGQYSGKFAIIYTVTPSGPLKWDLLFTPNATGNYQITYEWQHGTHNSVLQADAKTFTADYPMENFTLNWKDVPASFAAKPILSPSEFSLSINLGTIASGHQITIDPTIASSVGSGATAFTFQRKIVYNSQSGYYFAFYHNGHTVGYSTSTNGTNWSSQQSMAPGWPGYNSTDFELSVVSAGQTVVVASGVSSQAGCGGNPCGITITPHMVYAYGTMSGGQINWQPTHYVGTASATCSSNGSVACTIIAGYRYVSVALSSTGALVLSYNYFENHQNDFGPCNNLEAYEVSSLYMNYSNHLLEPASEQGCTGPGYSNPPFATADNDRSILIPADSNGKVRLIYQFAGLNSAPSLYTTWFDGSSTVNYGTLQSTVPDNDQFSAVAEANYGQHIVYAMPDSSVSYAYLPTVGSSQWATSPNIFGVHVNSTTISVDYSTNVVYVVGVTPRPVPPFSNPGYYLIMKSKALNQNWSDEQAIYPVTSSTSAIYVSSVAISASASNAAQIAAIWTNGTSPNFNVAFASIPIQTVWSPYNTPPLPWDGNGLAPYGQYFSNEGEYVSPSTGMLTIRQTDLSVSGRGLNLAITRVYTEPFSFLGCPTTCQPYLYESYPWAPMGAGWQLNFPWMNDSSQPQFLHVADGQGYLIPSTFWTGLSATFENHQGENFRLVRFVNGTIVLYNKSGTTYAFGTPPTYPNHALRSITDSTGNNTITFSYSNSLISCITDTVGRAFAFSYSSGLLQSVSQVTGSCPSPGGGLTYGGSNRNLNDASDTAIVGVCFVAAKGGNIAEADFWLGGSSGLTGSVVAQVYSTSGSIPNYPSAGNGCAGKSSLLSTSMTSIDMSTLSTSGAQRVGFTFNSGSITQGQEYVVAIKATFTNTACGRFWTSLR